MDSPCIVLCWLVLWHHGTVVGHTRDRDAVPEHTFVWCGLLHCLVFSLFQAMHYQGGLTDCVQLRVLFLTDWEMCKFLCLRCFLKNLNSSPGSLLLWCWSASISSLSLERLLLLAKLKIHCQWQFRWSSVLSSASIIFFSFSEKTICKDVKSNTNHTFLVVLFHVM